MVRRPDLVGNPVDNPVAPRLALHRDFKCRVLLALVVKAHNNPR